MFVTLRQNPFVECAWCGDIEWPEDLGEVQVQGVWFHGTCIDDIFETPFDEVEDRLGEDLALSIREG